MQPTTITRNAGATNQDRRAEYARQLRQIRAGYAEAVRIYLSMVAVGTGLERTDRDARGRHEIACALMMGPLSLRGLLQAVPFGQQQVGRWLAELAEEGVLERVPWRGRGGQHQRWALRELYLERTPTVFADHDGPADEEDL